MLHQLVEILLIAAHDLRKGVELRLLLRRDFQLLLQIGDLPVAIQLLQPLGDAEAGVRENAIRLSEPFLPDPALVTRLLAMTSDPDPRMEMSFALGPRS